MPWNVQGGGGPWGPSGGGNGPWGGGQKGPDIEDLLRRGQDRMRGLLPGGLGAKGIMLIAVALFVLWCASGFYTVEPEEEGVELMFGKYYQTTKPGLNYHFPYPFQTLLVVPVLTVRREEIGFLTAPEGARGGGVRNVPSESLMLTGDENIIETNFVVQWAVKDAAAYIFNVRNPRQTVRDAAESAMREVVGKTTLAAALAEGRERVADQTEVLLQRILDEYLTGIIVTDLLLQRSDPPEAVIDDYRDVQRAKADQERLINEAQAYHNRILPEASGQAAQVRQEAQAYKEQVVARAEGSAKRFLAVYEQYRLAKEVTKKRIYLETMERVFRDMNKVIIDSGEGGAGAVVPYLPLPEIQKRAAGARGAGQ
jgi:membrane protease subunit HflK